MCGIVGYVGNRECKELLLTGLERLEYRGYDSAGIALVNGTIDITRRVGRVETLRAAVGNGSAFYYISSVEGQSSFLAPKEKDRRVVAVYFGQTGSVDRVAQYGLKDGKVFDYVKNETPTLAKDEGLLKALFRNLGVKQLGLD